MIKSERTKAFIVERAAHLFNKRGYNGTSMSDIIEATGLTKGGIYGHFSSKEEIVVQAFEYASSKVMTELGLSIKAQDSAAGKLAAIVNYYYNYLDRSPIEGGCPILNYSAYMSDITPELKRAILAAVGKMLESIVNIAEKGKKYRQVKKKLNAKAFADLFYSRIQGAIMLAKATGESNKLNDLLDDLKLYIEKEVLV